MRNNIGIYTKANGYGFSHNRISRSLKGVGFLVFCLYIATYSVYNDEAYRLDITERSDDIIYAPGQRKLFEHTNKDKTNCTKAAIANFPRDIFTQSQRKNGAVVFHLLVSLYLFWAIAVCCDSYFVPSLQEMCNRMGLQTDVAGATLMAIGSSAPELFAAIIGVFITKGDIGIGTILGSAVFNVLFVIGACGLFSGKILTISWWPLTRDASCYGISLFVLTIVIFDEEVKWYEAMVMVLLYPAYVVLMYFNSRLEMTTYEYLGDEGALVTRFSKKETDEDSKNLMDDLDTDTQESAVDYTMIEMLSPGKSSTFNEVGEANKDDDTCDYGKSLFTLPNGVLRIAVWLIQLPISIVFYFTIPDVKKESCRKYYAIGFLLSIFWIGLLTYLLVWMVTIAGYTAGIHDAVMGLTFVAFGSSVPDCLSSLLVARQGDGDMAVSHTIGSNVFDILLCLGVPWLIKTTIVSPSQSVMILSHGLFISCFVIIGSLVFAMATIYLNNWRLGRRIGLLFLAAYLLFLILATVLEIKIFEKAGTKYCS